jgi:hypothetical protein
VEAGHHRVVFENLSPGLQGEGRDACRHALAIAAKLAECAVGRRRGRRHDLVARHADAGIELRITPSIWPVTGMAVM